MFHAMNTPVGWSMACGLHQLIVCLSLSACVAEPVFDESTFDARIETLESDSTVVDVNLADDRLADTDVGDTDVSVKQCTSDSYCPSCPEGTGNCGDYLVCIANCYGGGDYDACESSCSVELGFQGTTVLAELIQCGTSNSCVATNLEAGLSLCDGAQILIALPNEPDMGCFDVACLRTSCWDMYTGCFSGCEIRSCSELNDCIGKCGTDDPLTDVDEHEECVWSGCRRKACPEAQTKYDAYMGLTP